MTDTPTEAAIGHQAAIDLLAFEKALQRKGGRPTLLGERKKGINTCITPSDHAYVKANHINIATVLSDFVAKHRKSS